MPNVPLIVFTDLDATLLDHETYDWQPAKPVLDRLIAANVPVILASSKTAAEITQLRDAMGLSDCPAICENGAGLVPSGQGALPSPDAYRRLRRILDSLPVGLRDDYTGFGDMDVDGVAEATGLPRAEAALAAQRAFTEPGLWRGDTAELTAFLSALAAHGVSAREGGRFLTLGFGRRKVDAMKEVLTRYGNPPSIALGDAPNDQEMIEAATHGVIIPNPHRAPLPPLDGEAEGRVVREQTAGPAGWAHAVSALADRYL